MELLEGILTRRTVRKFTGEKLSHEQIEKLIYHASHAPSWANSQCVRFVALTEDAAREAMARQACTGNNVNNVLGAAVVFVLCGVKGKSGYLGGKVASPDPAGWMMFDCGGAAEALCLAAHGMGLGTVQIGHFDQQKAGELIGLPEDMQVVELIACGYPAQTPEKPKRLEVDELLRYNHF